MHWNRAFRLHSFAHLFSILFFGLVFTTAHIANAECDKEAKEIVDACKEKTYRAKNLTECRNMEKECKSSSPASGDRCAEARRNADSAKSNYFKACKDAGMGASTCNSKISACESAGSDEEYGNSAELLVAFSAALGVPQNQVASQCPKYSGQGFFDRKDKLTDKLKDINRELKDNKKELADLNKEFNDDVKKIQEDIAEAQKEYQEKQADTKKNQRDRAAEQAKTAAEMAQNIRKLESSILQKQQEKDTIYADKNSSLKQLTEDVANSTCMDEVRKDYESRKSIGSQKKGSTKSLISSGKSKNNRMKMIFNQCMTKFYDARIKLIQQSDAKIETIEKEIRNAQSDIDDMKTQLSQMASIEQQAKQDEETALTQAQTALQEKIQRATTELQSLQQTTQQKAKAITDDQANLANESKSISNQIAGLGPEPDDATSTGKMSDVTNAADEYKSAVSVANGVAECEYKDNLFGGSGGSVKAGSKNQKRGGSGSSKTAQ